ncbi:iron-containing alcohol dehydrogenase [Occallatibacter riparius]|uniref:Iron-containing alcohol dehydrogenase n=1 Tax=Occallatibacter riparius TaxID=1002689 RepID=A0A9J7BRA9_9BACT|nr:iron-containing alcohol dehydrogenase [Occallatibacter riparius]UWZ85412.1 iron-containing alcohol dehydrogenase [Occallatibacter riparius]
MPFEFATATRIIFGEGASASLPELARTFGTRFFVVTGATPDRASALISALDAVTFSIPGEPTVDLVRQGAQRAVQAGCDVIISIGGGSAIDAGKAIAALATNGGEPLDFLEVVGRGRSISIAPLPFIAVPTTAGTGSEVTRNAVLGSPEHGVKASMRSPMMLPRIALVDPELTWGLPLAVTARTGLDALTQLIEPYVSKRANPLVDPFCTQGIRLAAGALRRVYRDGSDREARRDMAQASLFGGLALANAGLGVVHGFASPLGGSFDAPHGALCAAILPHGMAVNLAALRARAPQHPALERYAAIARLLTGRADATADDGIAWVRTLCADLKVPPLRAWGISETDLARIVDEAARASSMQANPLPLTSDELLAVANAAL